MQVWFEGFRLTNYTVRMLLTDLLSELRNGGIEIDENKVLVIFQRIRSNLDTPLEVIFSTPKEIFSFYSELSLIMANTLLKKFPPGFVEDFSQLLICSQKKDASLTSSLVFQFLMNFGAIPANLTPNVPSATIVVTQKKLNS